MNSLFLFISLFTSLFSAGNPELTIKISNIEKIKGEIKIGVFNQDKYFLIERGSIKNY